MRDSLVSEAKIILNLGNDKHQLLYTLAAMVENDFLNYCGREDLPPQAHNILLQMLLIKYNRLGVEGLASQSFSGISESYINGYPEEIKKQLNNYRKLVVL